MMKTIGTGSSGLHLMELWFWMEAKPKMFCEMFSRSKFLVWEELWFHRKASANFIRLLISCLMEIQSSAQRKFIRLKKRILPFSLVPIQIQASGENLIIPCTLDHKILTSNWCSKAELVKSDLSLKTNLFKRDSITCYRQRCRSSRSTIQIWSRIIRSWNRWFKINWTGEFSKRIKNQTSCHSCRIKVRCIPLVCLQEHSMKEWKTIVPCNNFKPRTQISTLKQFSIAISTLQTWSKHKSLVTIR